MEHLPTQYRVKELSNDILADKVSEIVAKTFQTAGWSTDNTTIAMMTVETVNDIRNHFNSLSLEEINTAFYEGVRGNYCDYQGINLVSFHKWLKYYKENHHFKYVQEHIQGQKLLESQTELTDGEKEQILIDGVKRCYLTWKKSKQIVDYGNPVFDFLKEKEKIKLTEIEWSNYMLKAKIEVTGQLKAQAVGGDRGERMDAKRLLQDIDSNAKIESLAKNMALADYFKKISK